MGAVVCFYFVSSLLQIDKSDSGILAPHYTVASVSLATLSSRLVHQHSVHHHSALASSHSASLTKNREKSQEATAKEMIQQSIALTKRKGEGKRKGKGEK